jgi:hypothetical protein
VALNQATLKARREAAQRLAAQYGEDTARDLLVATGVSDYTASDLLKTYPEEPDGERRIITFNGFGGYYYAALKMRGKWYVTQDATSYGSFKALTWEELVDKFGQQFRDSFVVRV